MPLSVNRLGDAMKGAIDALSSEEKQDRTEIFRALADAIVNEIKDNAAVSVTVTVTTTGTAAAQSGGGSGTGTVS